MTTYGPDLNGVVRSVPDRSSAEPENQAEALDEKALAAACDAYNAFELGSDVDHVRKIVDAFLASLPEAPAVPVVKALSVDEIETIILATEPSEMSDRGDQIWTRRMAVGLSKALAALQSSPPVTAAVDGEVLNRLTHERNLLAEAIANAALKAGIYNGEVPLTGPHLLILAEDLAALASQPAVADAWVRDALVNLAHEMRFLLRQNPDKDGGLYRQRLDEADAALALAKGECPHRCDEGGVCLAEHSGFPQSCPRASLSLAAKREQPR
jgi:hypothetical protein